MAPLDQTVSHWGDAKLPSLPLSAVAGTTYCVERLQDHKRDEARTPIGVRDLLEWAFSVECAQLDFDEEAGRAVSYAVDPIYRMMRQAELGCRVDGGGESPRHSDAEIIAAVVARLPVAHGGKGMAVRVAQLARACDEPDYMGGETPRVVPADWRCNRHGWRAATERVGVERVMHRGRVREVEVRACPITWSPSAARIASARREYLAWWGALMHIAIELRGIDLAGWRVTAAMPDLEPWRKSS